MIYVSSLNVHLTIAPDIWRLLKESGHNMLITQWLMRFNRLHQLENFKCYSTNNHVYRLLRFLSLHLNQRRKNFLETKFLLNTKQPNLSCCVCLFSSDVCFLQDSLFAFPRGSHTKFSFQLDLTNIEEEIWFLANHKTHSHFKFQGFLNIKHRSARKLLLLKLFKILLSSQ